MSLIALEEHYAWDPASTDHVVATWLRSNNEVAYQRLYDRGPLRLEQAIGFLWFQQAAPGLPSTTGDVASNESTGHHRDILGGSSEKE